MWGSSMSGCPRLMEVPPVPLSLFRGCVRKALLSCVVRQPQMRPYLLLGRLLDSEPTLCTGGRCARDDRSDRERQQVSELVIQRLEPKLHCLSRKKGLQ
jgi:hypothetical protein